MVHEETWRGWDGDEFDGSFNTCLGQISQESADGVK